MHAVRCCAGDDPRLQPVDVPGRPVDAGPVLPASRALPAGWVALVGAGPGDPEFLTLRAWRWLAAAEVLVFDHLVSPEVLACAAPAAERVYVGKESACHTLPQEQINALLLDRARSGRRVVRLKGGDPFIFGRGGEEAAFLTRQGIPVEVVPGITAATGCAATAGIPLTHRDFAQACIFATGHRKDGTFALDWPMLARRAQTVVFYMGLAGLDEICRQLITHGLPADWPAAVIANGTTRQQQVVIGDLASLASRVAAAELQAPCLALVGQVVRLYDGTRTLAARPADRALAQ